MIGQTVSHYRIVTQLGAGGMGVVYGADDIRLGRPVALKFIPDDLASDRHAIERFRIEARAASALNHANICTVYDIGDHDGHPFIVMEWIKGQTLHDRIARAPLKVAQIVDMAIEIADALRAAHSQGIMHRDIKPANIFLTDRGHVKVMDFGLAKLLSDKSDEPSMTGELGPTLTLPGMTLGTASYMSPEQAAGDALDCRSDLFSVGVVLYECATGRRPFTGSSARSILGAILHKTPLAPATFNPEMPSRLQDIIHICLEKDPELRYQTAGDLGADLKRLKRDIESGRTPHVSRAGHSRHVDGETAPHDPEVPDSRSPTTVRARRLKWAGGAGAIAIVLMAAVVGYQQSSRREPTPVPASTQPPTPDFVDERVALAERSLQQRQYRTAHAYAEDVLAANPNHPSATKVRDEAAAMLSRADASIRTARALVARGDVRGAVRALDDARTIDPNAAGIAEVSALLAQRFKAEAETAQSELQRSRASLPSQPQTRPQLDAVSRAAPTVAPGASPPLSRNVSPPPVAAEPPLVVPVSPALPPPQPPPAPIEPPDPAPKAPLPAPSPASESKRTTDPAIDDEAAIRGVVAAYARAIESKDLAMFRLLKPNLGAEEEKRIERGFRAVATQKVNITILSIDRRDDRAVVQLRRQDVIEAGGRRHTPQSRQTMTLAKTNGAWVIVEIGG